MTAVATGIFFRILIGVRRNAETGFSSLQSSLFWNEPLRDLLLTAECPIEKATQQVDLLCKRLNR